MNALCFLKFCRVSYLIPHLLNVETLRAMMLDTIVILYYILYIIYNIYIYIIAANEYIRGQLLPEREGKAY